MNYIKKALTTLGGIFLAALLLAALAPKATHGLVAALVQLVPGTTTQVGQNESQLVSLSCDFSWGGYCVAINPDGTESASAYTAPSGYTLIVTDYQFAVGGITTGYQASDALIVYPGGSPLANGYALADKGGVVYGHEHYSTGIRVGSGQEIADYFAAYFKGQAWVQGYLVPN